MYKFLEIIAFRSNIYLQEKLILEHNWISLEVWTYIFRIYINPLSPGGAHNAPHHFLCYCKNIINCNGLKPIWKLVSEGPTFHLGPFLGQITSYLILYEPSDNFSFLTYRAKKNHSGVFLGQLQSVFEK